MGYRFFYCELSVPRRLVLAIGLVGCFFLSSAVSSWAVRPSIPDERTVSSETVIVHFAPGSERAAEATLTSATSEISRIPTRLHFAPLLSDVTSDPSRDGRFDVYLMPWGTSYMGRSRRGGAVPDGTSRDAAPGFIFLFPDSYQHITHEMFHIFQHTVDRDEGTAPSGWWAEVTAEWAEHTLNPESEALSFGPVGWPTRSMLCADPPEGSCFDTAYPWWPFASYLTDRFGEEIIHEIWLMQGELGRGNYQSHARAAIEAVLIRHGSTFADVFTDFANDSAFARHSGAGGFALFGTDLLAEGATEPLVTDLEPWSIHYVTLPAASRSRIVVTGVDTRRVQIRIRNDDTARVTIVSPLRSSERAVFTLPPGLHTSSDVVTLVIANTDDARDARVGLLPPVNRSTRIHRSTERRIPPRHVDPPRIPFPSPNPQFKKPELKRFETTKTLVVEKEK